MLMEANEVIHNSIKYILAFPGNCAQRLCLYSLPTLVFHLRAWERADDQIYQVQRHCGSNLSSWSMGANAFRWKFRRKLLCFLWIGWWRRKWAMWRRNVERMLQRR